MKNLKDLLTDFESIQELPVSEEMLGAYIEGQLNESEKNDVESQIHQSAALNDLVLTSQESETPGYDWSIHDGDYGFWELGIPPVVTQDDIKTLDDYIDNNINNTISMLNKIDPSVRETTGGVGENKTYGYESNNQLNTFDPDIWQGDNNACAVRSQEIVLRDYGIKVSLDELIEFATKKGWFDPDPDLGGTPKEAVGNILEAFGLKTNRTDNATIFDIIAELRAGHRVIVTVDADELWVKKEPGVMAKLFGNVTNKINDSVQNFLGFEGANHALVVAGVNVNPQDPSDIKVVLIDSGSGDVCIEYDFKDFQNAWSDGHCQMISTEVAAPYQYNYHTHQMEPSGFKSDFFPSLIELPEGLENSFQLPQTYFEEYKFFKPMHEYIDEQSPFYDFINHDEGGNQEQKEAPHSIQAKDEAYQHDSGCTVDESDMKIHEIDTNEEIQHEIYNDEDSSSNGFSQQDDSFSQSEDSSFLGNNEDQF